MDGIVQQLWLVEKVVAIDADGEKLDISKEMLDLAGKNLAKPVEVSSSAKFAVSSSFKPEMIDIHQDVLSTVDMQGGILETDEGHRSVAILATPEEGEWTIGMNYSLRLDIPEVEAVTNGSPVSVDYGYVQYLPIKGASGLEADSSPLKLMRARAAANAVAFSSDGSVNLEMFTGEIGTARAIDPASSSESPDSSADDTGSEGTSSSDKSGNSGDEEASVQVDQAGGPALQLVATGERPGPGARAKSEARKAASKAAIDSFNQALVDRISQEAAVKLDIPADALPLLDGITKGAMEALEGRCRGAACIQKLTDSIEKGFKESWDLIKDKWDYEEDVEVDEGGGGGDGGSSGAGGSYSGGPGGGGYGNGGGSSGGDSGGSGGSGGGNGGGKGSGKGGGSGSGGSDGGGDGGGDGSGGDKGGKSGGSGKGGGSGSAGSDSGGSGSDGGSDGGDGSGGKTGKNKTDPHIVTFDGRSYSLQVVGELTAAVSGPLEVQVRYEPVQCNCVASLTTAVAVSDGENTIEVKILDQWLITVDGKQIDLNDPDEMNGKRSLSVGAFTVERKSGGVLITDGAGNVVDVNIG
ncbi:MAG TPA: hypothetical protein VL068_10510 [Microthrixaceae bacterium]|nr:hypothetical protein [Microthrixaceae bacterium]